MHHGVRKKNKKHIHPQNISLTGDFNRCYERGVEWWEGGGGGGGSGALCLRLLI